MRNDLIVFEFHNDDDREILILPEIVTRLADVLKQAFDSANRLAIEYRGDGTIDDEVQIWLSATERGSLKLAFRALFHPNSTQDFKEAMEATNLALDAMFKLMKIVATAWVTIEAVQFVNAPTEVQEQPKELSGDRAEEFRHSGDQMLAIGYECGVDRICITMPDQPEMLLAMNPELHVAALGSTATPVDASLLGVEIEGILEPGSKRLETRLMGQQGVTLYSGRFRVKNGLPIPVLFRWNSMRPLPTGIVEIRGRLSSVQSVGVQPLNPITADLRAHGTFLDVYKQLVAE